MITLSIILLLALLGGVIKLAISLSWGILKLVFGLALFVLCPAMLIILIVGGLLGVGFIPLVIIAILAAALFRRA